MLPTDTLRSIWCAAHPEPCHGVGTTYVLTQQNQDLEDITAEDITYTRVTSTHTRKAVSSMTLQPGPKHPSHHGCTLCHHTANAARLGMTALCAHTIAVCSGKLHLMCLQYSFKYTVRIESFIQSRFCVLKTPAECHTASASLANRTVILIVMCPACASEAAQREIGRLQYLEDSRVLSHGHAHLSLGHAMRT